KSTSPRRLAATIGWMKPVPRGSIAVGELTVPLAARRANLPGSPRLLASPWSADQVRRIARLGSRAKFRSASGFTPFGNAIVNGEANLLPAVTSDALGAASVGERPRGLALHGKRKTPPSRAKTRGPYPDRPPRVTVRKRP